MLFFKNNNKFILSFKFLAAIFLAAFLSSCGYHDDLHMRHHQLWLLWNGYYQQLETSLDQQYGLYKKNKLKGAEFSRQIQSIEYVNDGGEQRLAGYVQAMPNSKWSHLLYGLYLVKQAKDMRGIQTIDQTSQGSIDQMKVLAERAKPLLEAANQHQSPFGLYAGGMINVNRMLQTEDENRRLVNEAIARDGDIWRAPTAYFITLYPQWGGSEGAMAQFVLDVKPAHPILAKALQADFFWRRGKDYAVSGQADAAIAEYEKAVELYPDEYALKDLGEKYMQRGDCEAAVKLFERNLDENDEWDWSSLESLKQAYQCAGKTWKASRVDSKIQELLARFTKGE